MYLVQIICILIGLNYIFLLTQPNVESVGKDHAHILQWHWFESHENLVGK